MPSDGESNDAFATVSFVYRDGRGEWATGTACYSEPILLEMAMSLRPGNWIHVIGIPSVCQGHLAVFEAESLRIVVGRLMDDLKTERARTALRRGL